MRYEIKYIVPSTFLPSIRAAIQPFVRPDKHVLNRPGNEYTVRSIYFDTPDLNYYVDKIEGVPFRYKLRLRGYNTVKESPTVFLEIKKRYKIPIRKTRSQMPYKEALTLFRDNNAVNDVSNAQMPSNRASAGKFFYRMGSENLLPVVLVVYEREPYLSLYDDTVRITFDKNLRSAPYPSLEELYDEDKLKPVLTDNFILEVKYNDHYPAWMKRIIYTFQLRQRSASKYCKSIDNHQLLARSKAMEIHTRAKLFST